MSVTTKKYKFCEMDDFQIAFVRVALGVEYVLNLNTGLEEVTYEDKSIPDNLGFAFEP